MYRSITTTDCDCDVINKCLILIITKLSVEEFYLDKYEHRTYIHWSVTHRPTTAAVDTTRQNVSE